MKNSSRKNPWPSRLLSLIFAVLLFTFVHYENSSRIQSTSPSNGASITSVEVLTDIPIGIDIDQDQYFVSGIPETATVRLEGPQAILTQTLATRNFEIVTPDLNELDPGTHVIQLRAEGISSQLDYSIMPSEVSVVIEEKVVNELDVNVEFDATYLEEGYQAGTPQLSQDTVAISGAASVMEQINQVSVVVVPEEGNVTEDIDITLPVLVFDSAGELLNVNIEPSQVDVYIPVEGTQKNLPIVLRQTGEEETDRQYTLEIAQGEPETIQVSGDEATLEDLDNFVVEVDVSGVTESTLRTIPLIPPDGVTETTPEELDVVIRVTPAGEENTENGENSGDEEEPTSAPAENEEDTTEDTNDTTEGADETSTDEPEGSGSASTQQQPDSANENDE